MLRYTLSINQGLAGWSETFWFAGDTINPAAEQRGITLAEKRAGSLNQYAKVVAIRTTALVVGTPPASIITIVSLPDDGTSAGLNSELPWTGYSINFLHENGKRFRRTFRGVEDDKFRDAANIAGDAIMTQEMQVFLDYLASENWCHRFLKLTDNPTWSIGSVDVDQDTGVATVTAAAHGLVANDRAVFYDMHGLVNFPRTARVLTNPTANTFTVLARQAAGVYSAGGEVRKEVYVLGDITSWTKYGASKRDVGRPFGLPRGRRRRERS